MTYDGSPSLTGVNFAGSGKKKKVSAGGSPTAPNPDQCDIYVAPLCAVRQARVAVRTSAPVTYDTSGTFYYLIRNAAEINKVAAVTEHKSPSGTSGEAIVHERKKFIKFSIFSVWL